MVFRMLYCVLVGTLLLSCNLSFGAEIPEYYSILAEPTDTSPVEAVPPAKDTVWKPSRSDISRGFAAYIVDTSVKPNPSWVWNEPSPTAALDFFMYRGQFKGIALAVRTLQEIEGLSIECSELKGPKRSVIPKEYTDIRTVAYTSASADDRTVYEGKWMQKSIPNLLPKHYTLWVWLTFHADKDTPAGIYNGTLTLTSQFGKRALKIPVRALVPDITVNAPQGSFGYYVPGHFNMTTKGIYRNWAHPNYTASNIDRYFRFWRTRNLTSATFYHVYPGLKCVDEHTQVDFADLGRMVEGVKKAGLTGDVCVDMRMVEWWSNIAAGTLNHLKSTGQSTAGDIGVHGESGWWTEEYSDESKRLTKEAAEQLKEKSEKESWPRVLVLAEEELWEPHKRATFDEFTPVLQQVFPDTTYIVDNSIGYSGMTLDRGEIFDVKIRQYNNWTEEGLAAAKRQNAQVRSYNFGWSRCTWGFLQTRLGSDSHHQWADMWYSIEPELTSYRWVATQLSSEGVTPSMLTEVSHEGLDDYAYVQTLLTLAAEKGQLQLQESTKLVRDLVSDIPVNAMIYHPWLIGLQNEELETRRWQVALAINALSGNRDYTKPAPGKPKLVGAAQLEVAVETPDLILSAPRVTEEMTIDGKSMERCWSNPKNSTGSFKWLKDKEAQLLAAAGDQGNDEIPLPSATHARFAYGPEGIYILSQCNHTTLENARAERGEDDPELWQDDCMEYFFETDYGSGNYHHLIVNPKGAKVMIYGSDIVKNTGIEVASINLNNPSGGYAQEIFIPWKALGIAEMPKQGTVWRMNAAREFNSWGHLMSWAPVRTLFAEMGRWGLILFAGEPGKVSVDKMKLGSGFPGENKITGTIVPEADWSSSDVVLSVLDHNGKLVSAQSLLRAKWEAEPAFAITYTVPNKISPEMWELKITDTNGNLLTSVPVPVRSENSSVEVLRCPKSVIGGKNLCIQVKVNVGDVSRSRSKITAEITNLDGKKLTLSGIKMADADTQNIWLSSNGLAPGIWKLQLDVNGTKSPSDVLYVNVLPCPTAK